MFGSTSRRLRAVEADRDNLDAIVRTQRAEIERLRKEVEFAKGDAATWKNYADRYAEAATAIRETLRRAACASAGPVTPQRIEGQR